MKESLPSTQSNNALVKPSINSPKRSSVISFTQLKEAESKASKDRIENFETLFQLKENDNDGLKNILY